MTPEAIAAVVPVLRAALHDLTLAGESEQIVPWSVTAKCESSAGETPSRWDVKLDREDHLTVQRQS